MGRSNGIAAQIMKEEETMSCRSDVMKPVEASLCCTLLDFPAQAPRTMRDSGWGWVVCG